jgi:hypothetical protein
MPPRRMKISDFDDAEASSSPLDKEDPFRTRPEANFPEDVRQENLARDPFLTRSYGAAEATQEPLKTQKQLPPRPRYEENVAADPFLTGHRIEGGNIKARKRLQDSWKAFQRLLGPGDPARRKKDLYILVLGPFLSFAVVLLAWLILQPFSFSVCLLLTVSMVCLSMVCFFSGYQRRSLITTPVALLPLGLMCLLATAFGTLWASIGWNLFWEQTWWSYSGNIAKRTSALTPALETLDASTVSFWSNETAQQTMNQTSVDSSRSSGYKNGNIYCVAPILSPDQEESDLALVNFWAVGIDCCQPSGSFTCDGARLSSAGVGIVMLNGGYPCPTCNNDNFQLAVRKAEAEHHLVSSPNAVFVRWTDNARLLRFQQLTKGIMFLLISLFSAGIVFLLMGGYIWHNGIGSPSHQAWIGVKDKHQRAAEVSDTRDV